MPKEPYIWDYKIRVKTQDGDYKSEEPDEEDIDCISAKIKVKRKEMQHGKPQRNDNEKS